MSESDTGMKLTIRPEVAADHESIRHVNRLAFAQDDEARLVDALREGGYVRLSLVAEQAGQVVGHILFSDLPIITESGTVASLALAPMAVLPEFQRQGIGSALVRRGLGLCREQGHRIVIVLGHSHFYPRFGFSSKLASTLASPFGGGDSWMALELVAGALTDVEGRVDYPPPFEPAPEIGPEAEGKTLKRSVRTSQRTLLLVEGTFAICRLDGDASIPSWITAGPFFSITRTAEELSVVCRQDAVPEGVVCERGWRCLRVAGTMPFSVIGVLASLTTPLADAGISVFAVSTFDTDYLLVKEADFGKAIDVLRWQGHTIQ
jgi:putative acetyltransferase